MWKIFYYSYIDSYRNMSTKKQTDVFTGKYDVTAKYGFFRSVIISEEKKIWWFLLIATQQSC